MNGTGIGVDSNDEPLGSDWVIGFGGAGLWFVLGFSVGFWTGAGLGFKDTNDA